ncbi:hypothetical protein AXF42_Ash000662 [Apostasia shenzhenica]|uniref:Uncharacterized protein n=1 Tax=Apostasia shenzhenica TaxID=1088818 RepID=A0A2I0AGZ5_9ASPA|nr:hypothetical protein AXF42_Ash000662 [Apostasia shenzhenica]
MATAPSQPSHDGESCDDDCTIEAVADCFCDEQPRLSQKVSATVSTVVDTICDDGICDSVSDGYALSQFLFCDGLRRICDRFCCRRSRNFL